MNEKATAAKRKNEQNMLLFLAYPPLQKQMDDLRKLNATQLKDAVLEIVKKHRLPRNYAPHIEQYIQSETKDAPMKNFEVSSADGEVRVRIYAHLNKEEVAELKKELDQASENLPDFRALVNFKYKFDDYLAIQGVRKRNVNPKKEYHETYRKALNVSPKNAQSARDHAREIEEIQKKRFG